MGITGIETVNDILLHIDRMTLLGNPASLEKGTASEDSLAFKLVVKGISNSNKDEFTKK
jgi:hypothetical protein